MTSHQTTVSFTSLGCFKNTVDTEVLGGMLTSLGLRPVSPYEDADWIIVNTCGFIQSAKEESIDEILSALEKKENSTTRHVAVTGCLSERYGQELKENFPQLDVVWGVNDPLGLARFIAGKSRETYRREPDFLYDHTHPRIITTPPNTSFIKISEGCDMKCSFCAIPMIRGAFRSRTVDSVVQEAVGMRERGVAELNLISQNSTHFGRDRGGESELPLLLKSLSPLGFDWIRVLYLMPEAVTPEIIAGFHTPHVLPYFDLPFQHVSAPLLKQMNRGGDSASHAALISRIRGEFPDAVIRSTFIVGFPGETESQFNELCDFALNTGIEHFGAFAFSPEEDTPAFDLEGRLDPEELVQRRETLMDISDANLEAFNQRIQSTTTHFLPAGPSPWESGATLGRIESQAPEVDGFTEIHADLPATSRPIPVKITGYRQNILQGVTQ